MILPTYDFAYSFYDRMAIVKKNKQSYVINMHEERISPIFSDIIPGLAGYLCKKEGEKLYECYDLAFNPLGSIQFDYAYVLPNVPAYLVRLWQGNRHLAGILNAQGITLVPPIYEDLKPLSKSKTTIENNGVLPKAILDQPHIDVLFTAEDIKYKCGLIDITNETIIPFKYKYDFQLHKNGGKKYAETIQARIASGNHEKLVEQLEQAYQAVKAKTADFVASLPTDIKRLSPMVVTPVEGGYSLQRDGKSIDGIVYTSVIDEDSLYIVEHNEKYGIKDYSGMQIVPTRFDGILPWNEVKGKAIYLALENDKYQLYDSNGKELLLNTYDAISTPMAGFAYAMDTNGCRLLDEKGHCLNYDYFDNIDIASDGTVTASRLGYQTTLTNLGKEKPAIASLIFNEAYNDTDPSRQIEKYQLAIEADPDNTYDIQAKALNNIGLIYEQKGRLETALAFYDQARAKGNNLAENNASRLRAQIRKAKIDGIVTALNQFSQALGNSQGATTTTGNTQLTDDAGIGSSSVGGSGRSYDYYQSNYNRWEKVARMAYETLTNTGYRTSDKNGKAKGGSSAGSFSSAHYSSIKRNLRNAQKEMRECRREARKDGHTIPESEYETVTTSF